MPDDGGRLVRTSACGSSMRAGLSSKMVHLLAWIAGPEEALEIPHFALRWRSDQWGFRRRDHAADSAHSPVCGKPDQAFQNVLWHFCPHLNAYARGWPAS